MVLHDNIRFLRKRHRFSQIELAVLLKINRSNVASYEKGTNPPVDILVNIANIFNVSLDLLLTRELESLLKHEGLRPLPESISVADLTGRLEQFIGLVGKDTNSLASLIGINEKTIVKLLRDKQSADLDLFCKVFSTFSWLNANWLMKGGTEFPVRIGDDVSGDMQLPDAAESSDKLYQSGLLKTMNELKKRIEQLEKEAGKQPAK